MSSPTNAARSAGFANRTSASSPNVASGLLARAAPLMSAPVSRRAARRARANSARTADRATGPDRADRGERGRRDSRPRRKPARPVGHVALAALLDQLHQTVLLKGLDVVVDLLPSKPKPRRECGRGVWLGQLREHPSPDRIERDLRGRGILDHCDILHAVTLSPTILIVKTVRTVWKNFISCARRDHAPQLPRAPVGTGAPPCQPVV